MDQIIKKDKILLNFIEKIQKHLLIRYKEIILYGSRARGEHHKNSDYDILILVDKSTNDLTDMIDEITGEILYKYNAIFSVIIMDKEDFKKQLFNPLLMNIRKEGIHL